jgi:hypothetical protein
MRELSFARRPWLRGSVLSVSVAWAAAGCSGSDPAAPPDAGTPEIGRDAAPASTVDAGSPSARDAEGTAPAIDASVDAGAIPVGANANANGHCAAPSGVQAEDVTHPTTVVGDGTPASCTGDKVVAAVHAGGVVTFACGADPIVIVVPEIDIFNDGGLGDGSVTIDGGGKVTLSGGGSHRVIYQNTCDQALHWTTSHCDAQSTPKLVVQNIGFTAGSGPVDAGVLGGGAIYVGGGTFKAVNAKFYGNSQPTLGQDYAGGAVYTTNQTAPDYVIGSTFSDNSGSNGGALGSIGTSWTIVNSVFSSNLAVGHGENPARAGTTGGGLGGAVYNDGNSYTLSVCGTDFGQNTANELGSGSIFQVVDDLMGDLVIDQSSFEGDSNTGSVQSHASIYVEARDKTGNAGVTVTNSTFQ